MTWMTRRRLTQSTQSPKVPLHVMTNVCTSNSMQVCIQVGDATLHALLDSGSMHNLIFEEALAHTNL